jgi:hypothetical protein
MSNKDPATKAEEDQKVGGASISGHTPMMQQYLHL